MKFITLLEQAVIVHRCIEEGETRVGEVARRARISITESAAWLRLFKAGVGHENL